MPSRPSPDKMRRFAVALLLTATVFLALSPALDGGFLSLDDKLYVTGNARVLSGTSWAGVRWAFSASDAGYWHPLTWLSYMADIELFGENPRWFHFVNLSFHAANSLLLLTVLAGLTGAFWRSAVVSFIFAVHPLHVESVAWIAERKDVLFAFFWLLAMGAYRAYVKRPGAGRYLAVASLFAMGLMAKPMMVTFPFVLLLLDFWPLGRFRPRPLAQVTQLILEKIPLLLLSALSSGVAYFAQQKAGAVRSLAGFPFPSRVANAAVSYLAYLGDTVWPAQLSVIYPHPREGIVWWQAVGAGLLLLGISAVFSRAAGKRPALIVGWAWFLGSLVPVIGLVQVGLQSRADRFTYVPQIGIGLLVVWGVFAGSIARRRLRPLLIPAAAVALLALAGMTRRQAGYWLDDDTLLGHAIEAIDDNWLAHRHLALSLQQRGRREEAVPHLREVRRIKPGYLDTHAAFGLAVPAEGGAGGVAGPGAATARLNRANELARRGLLDEAVREYREVLNIAPRHGLALHNLAGALRMQGDVAGAIEHYRLAAEILPRNADVQANYGRALFEHGETDEALAALGKAARINRRHTQVMSELANSLRARGDADGARQWYRAALDLDPTDPALRAGLDALR